MSPRRTSPSSQNPQRSSPSEPLPNRDSKSDTLRNGNGKRPRDCFQEDRLETARKTTRLNGDHHSEPKECEQLPNSITEDPNPTREQHFTTGPGRIIYIDEGGKRCPAICFNKGLLNIYNQIAEFTREVLEGDKSVQKAQLELERIKSSNRSAALEGAKRAAEEAIKSQEDIEAAVPGLMEARRQHETLTRENRWSKLKLDNSTAVAQMIIEQILNRENLLTNPSSKPQESTAATKNHSQEPAPVAEKTVDDIPYSDGGGGGSESAQSPTAAPEQQLTPRQIALRELRFAAEDLDYRKGDFAFMQEGYAQAVAANRNHRRERYPDRPASTTQTDLDLQILQKTQHATRKLIEAEEAYDRAERYAEDLGLGDILADPHACYYGEVYNDFQPRAERSVAVFPVNRARIEAWMASVPGPVMVVDSQRERDVESESVEVDHWDAKSVEVFESVSLVAYDMYRRKIDRWQEVSARFREGGVEGASPGTVG